FGGRWPRGRYVTPRGAATLSPGRGGGGEGRGDVIGRARRGQRIPVIARVEESGDVLDLVAVPTEAERAVPALHPAADLAVVARHALGARVHALRVAGGAAMLVKRAPPLGVRGRGRSGGAKAGEQARDDDS